MAIMAPFIALITLLVCHGFVSSRKRLGPEGRRSLVSHAPAVTSWTLSGLKYCMPMAAIAIVLCDFMGLMGLHSWGYSIKLAFNFGMFLRGEWDYILPPLLGLLFLVGSMFLVLDTLERVVRSRFSRWV